MKLNKIKIHNVRGISDLGLQLDSESIAIWGPNGVGKSSVVDAIEFLFTGKMSRLSGEGTGGINLSQHGPHIDHPPESAYVSAEVQVDGSDQPVQVVRRMANPGTLKCPAGARDILEEIGGVVNRGGTILTRRDILRFVTATAGTRADQIQDLLNLKEIETHRASLVQAQTRLKRDETSASKAVADAKSDVNAILGEESYVNERLLDVVNQCRTILAGQQVNEVNAATFNTDISPLVASAEEAPSINLFLISRYLDGIRRETSSDRLLGRRNAGETLRTQLTRLREDATLLEELERLALTDYALRFINDSTTECPVCGAIWTEGHLSGHLADKKATAKAAEEVKIAVSATAETVAEPARTLRANITGLRDQARNSPNAVELQAETELLDHWSITLGQLLTVLDDRIEQFIDAQYPEPALSALFAPGNVNKLLTRIENALREPVRTTTPEQIAWDTLTKLTVAVGAVENRTAREKDANASRLRADGLLSEFEKARDSVLDGLYVRIADRFKNYYCILHDHEKDHFDAKLQPQHGGLGFEVDFLGRGGHPPQALHSEGHQDSMGVCLFLALNDELAMPRLDLVVLDDVIMSVDSDHRKDVCRLLKGHFSDRQFIITTHDKTWSQQLKQEQVVQAKRLVDFTAWTVEGGPNTHQRLDLWADISEDLKHDRVREAAFKLRRGSEEFFEGACDALGAKLVYNSGLRWQLDDWLPAAMNQFKGLLSEARRAAASWGNGTAQTELLELESVRSQTFGRIRVEQWAINSTVHYNAWENMSRQDFTPVVEAFRDLHSLFQCSSCGFLIEATPPKPVPTVAKCRCGKVYWNLEKNSD